MNTSSMYFRRSSKTRCESIWDIENGLHNRHNVILHEEAGRAKARHLFDTQPKQGLEFII